MIVRQIHPWNLVNWAGTERPMNKAIEQDERCQEAPAAKGDEVVLLKSRSGDRAEARRRDSEVNPKAKRRTFSAKFKLRVLKEAGKCKDQEELGALLRREGLYASHLTNWKRQRDNGELGGRESKKRGPKPPDQNSLMEQVAELRRKNGQLEDELTRARAIIEAQKKISELLGTAAVGLQSTGAGS